MAIVSIITYLSSIHAPPLPASTPFVAPSVVHLHCAHSQSTVTFLPKGAEKLTGMKSAKVTHPLPNVAQLDFWHLPPAQMVFRRMLLDDASYSFFRAHVGDRAYCDMHNMFLPQPVQHQLTRKVFARNHVLYELSCMSMGDIALKPFWAANGQHTRTLTLGDLEGLLEEFNALWILHFPVRAAQLHEEHCVDPRCSQGTPQCTSTHLTVCRCNVFTLDGHEKCRRKICANKQKHYRWCVWFASLP